MAEMNLPETTAPQSDSSSGMVWRLALRFGVGVGLLCSLWLLGLHLTGNNAFGPKRLMVQFTVPIAVVACQWALRRALLPGKPGFGRALAAGGLTTVIGAAIAAGSLYGLANGAGETAMARNRSEMLAIARAEREYLLKRAGSEAAYQQHLTQLSKLTVTDLAQNDFSKILMLGLIFGLPGAVFFRE
jgi:hypothetical protein